jgi:hypothetical protein
MKNLTLHEMVITAIATKRYELKHGKAPAGLTTLVPEFLPAIVVHQPFIQCVVAKSPKPSATHCNSSKPKNWQRIGKEFLKQLSVSDTPNCFRFVLECFLRDLELLWNNISEI